MESIVISPKTKDEAKIVTDFLNNLKISSKVLTDEEKEDMGLLMMINEVDLNDLVSRDAVMKKLKS